MIVIFKTNVSCASDIDALKPKLDKYLSGSIWNFDLEDCDKILRVERLTQPIQVVIQLLKDDGFFCEEFPY